MCLTTFNDQFALDLNSLSPVFYFHIYIQLIIFMLNIIWQEILIPQTDQDQEWQYPYWSPTHRDHHGQ